MFLYLKSSCVPCCCRYFSVCNWRKIMCICWRHIVKMFVYLLRYIYHFDINVFVKIAGVCCDFRRVVHKTELFVAFMYIYLQGFKNMNVLCIYAINRLYVIYNCRLISMVQCKFTAVLFTGFTKLLPCISWHMFQLQVPGLMCLIGAY